MAGLNLPSVKKEITIGELRAYVVRLAEEIAYALDDLGRELGSESEASVLSNRALFLSEELGSLVNMQSGEGYISFGSISVCFGSLTLTAGAEKAQVLPVSYSGDYFVALTGTGDNCKGACLYTKDKENTGFTVVSSGGTGTVSVDFITVGPR